MSIKALSTQTAYPLHSPLMVNENEVNPDKVFCIAAQISDLSLHVFIPLKRLVSPQTDVIAPRISLISDSFLRQCYRDPLKYFEKSLDLTHLESILRILSGSRLSDERLATLSRYFEALSVYGGTLTATHWSFEEDRLSLTVWSMLSYYSHCLNTFSEECPHVLDLISKKLVQALAKDASILREIFEYEIIREQHDYLVLQLVELQVRKFYELTWEQPAVKEGGKNIQMWGMSALSNFPECRTLSEIKNRKIFSPQEKCKRAEEIWDALSSSHSARDRVTNSEEVMRISQAIHDLKDEMDRRKPLIERKTQKAALNDIKRSLQGLYEYEQLRIGLQCTEQLLKNDLPTQEALTQWLVVLRESLKMMVTDKSLNIPVLKSLSTLSNLVKIIRDYFEHPEDYVLKLDYSASPKKNIQLQELEAGLFEELKTMGQCIIPLIKIRLNKIQKIVSPHPSIDSQSALEALASRDAKQDKRLSDVRALACEAYPKIKDFAERVVDKREIKKGGSVKKDSLFVPFPDNLSPKELLDRLQKGCQALRSAINSLNRSQLEEKIVDEMPFRLMIQRQISVAAHLLEQFMKHLKKYPIEDSAYKTLENVYFEARDARNFQTHDLWRMDIQGIVNAVYLLGYDCPEVLSSLLKPENSSENQIVQLAVHGKLTQEILSQALADGFNLNARDYKMRSLLHFLADRRSARNLSLAQFVIKNNGNIHLADYVQKRPLHYAAASGFVELAQLLVEQGAVVDAYSRAGTPTEIAQHYGYPVLAQFLSNKRGARRSSNAQALLDAVNSLDIEKVQDLIEKNFDPLANFDGSLPLVALFEKEGIDFSIQIEIARILFQAGADIDQQEPSSGQSVLHAATTYTDEPEVIEFLMRFRPHVNLQDGQLQTPLHKAIRCNNARWVKALLEAGASVEERDCSGNTPLLSACDMNRPSFEIIQALLKHGANVEAENEFGKVLHHVVERGGDRSVSLILEQGASPFALGQGGLYYRKLPYELASNTQVMNRLVEKMHSLFFHLSGEEQEELITLTDRDSSLFQGWKRPILPTAEHEKVFIGRLYQRRFCWIS